MELKKNSKFDLEKYKSAFILIGLSVVLGITLLAFNWQAAFESNEEYALEEVIAEDEMVEITRQDIEPPKVELEPEQQKAPEVINLVSDDESLDEGFDFDMEAAEEDEVEIIEAEEEEEEVDNQVFVTVENMPEFPGGEIALRNYVAKNIKYPVEASENGIQGTVYLRFIVLKDGSIGEVQLQRGVDELLDEEATRVVKSLPKFKPGRQGGRNVSVWFSLPVKFKLN